MADRPVVVLKEAIDIRLVGGKASALSELIRAGFEVPAGFVISTDSGTTMTDELRNDIVKNFDALGAKFVAVRSSAVAEDGVKDAWAGQLDTFLDVDRNSLIDAVKKCWDSANSPRAKAYAKQKKLVASKVAVMVQAMVKGDVSGVAFSVHPVTQNHDHVIIEAVSGLAEALVSGKVTPDIYLTNKITGKIIEKTTQAAQALLSDEQIVELASLIIQLEKHFGFPVDVEWTIVKGKLYILQSRPITTLV